MYGIGEQYYNILYICTYENEVCDGDAGFGYVDKSVDGV